MKRQLDSHGHLDDDALHVLDSAEHAGGRSIDASVTIPGWAARASSGWCGTACDRR